MKLRFFTFLVSFLTVLSGAVWGQDGTFNISQKIVTGEGIELDGSKIVIKGDGRYLIKGDGNPYNYCIETFGDPEIILENVYFIHDEGPVVEINELGGGNLTLIIKGDNTIQTSSVGVLCTDMANVLFSNESTGRLAIRGSNPCIGNNRGVCGDVTISGGTIILDSDNAIDGSWNPASRHSVNITDNGVLITNGIFDNIQFDTKKISSGIFVDNTAEGNDGHVGKLWPAGNKNFVLKSPLDLTIENQSEILDLQGGKLTIGEGGSITADDKDLRNGIVDGVMIDYAPNRINGCKSTTGTKPNDFNFYSTNAPVKLASKLNCDADVNGDSGGQGKHQFLGWADDNKIYVDTYTTPDISREYYVDNVGNITSGAPYELKGAWAIEELDITVTNGVKMSPRTLLSTPDFVNYGRMEGLPDGFGITFDNNSTLDGTASVNFGDDESPQVFEATIPITANGISNVSAKLVIKVLKNKPDLSGANIAIKETSKSIIYDNEPHGDLLDVKVGGASLKEGVHYNVVYNYKKNEADQESEVIEVKEAGIYSVIRLEAESQSIGKWSGNLGVIEVIPRELNLKIKDQEVEVKNNLPELSNIIEVTNDQTDINDYWAIGHENAVITYSGNFGVKTDKAGKFKLKGDNIFINNISFNGGDISHNYTLGKIKSGILTVKENGTDDKPINPNPDDKPIIKPGDNGWTWDSEAESWTRVYDGFDHPFTSITVTYTDETVEGGTNTVELEIGESADANINYSTDEQGKTPATEIKDAGTYYAHITIKESEDLPISGVVDGIKLTITKAEVSVYFKNLTEDEIGKTLEANSWVKYYEDAVNEERPKISGTIKVAAKPNNNGKYKVSFNDLTLVENTEDDKTFKPNNYNAKWYYGNEPIVTDGDGNGSIDIEDPTDGDGDGGIIVDYNDLHIIKSTGAKLTSRYNKMRTKDGGSFTLSLEKEEGYEDCEPTVYIKRGRFDEWKVLKLDEVSGFYQIRNVYTDIYVKVSGDGIWPVSNEEVEAQEVKVYTQNGAIVVSTPSMMDVQIISMTGSVVAADKVAGQREFRNLAEGIYVVRVGDKIVKVRL